MARLVWLALLSSAAVAQERWFEVRIAGNPSGLAHEVVTTAEDGGLETASESRTLIQRLEAKLDLRVRAHASESPDGLLRRVHVETDLSAQTTFTDVTFAARSATVREWTGTSAPHERTIQLEAALLGPEEVRKRSARSLRQPGDELVLPVWAADLGMPARVRRTVISLENGLVRAEEKYEGTPVSRSVWLAPDGELQRSESPAPFGVLALVRTESEPALRAAELPRDTYQRTLLRSNVRLPQPRALQRMVARFTPMDALPATDTQRVVDGLVEVRRADPPAGPPDGDATGEFLGSNTLIDPDDPGIRAIVHEVPGEGWVRALALTRWTSQHMKFDLGIVFAPASELARNRRGTCVGYATLLASLLRTARIPSRIVFGYVYTGGIFGGHAWVEARFGGRWIPLDAALASGGPADAARIALAADSLQEGPGRILAVLQHAYTDAALAVVEYGGARAGETPYRVEEGRYVNPGLGLSLTAPAGLRFHKLDAVWPDRTLFELEGSGGSVKVEERELDPSLPTGAALRETIRRPCRQRLIAGRPGCAAGDRFVVAVGTTAFLVEARGPDAARILGDTARRIELK
jgi:transglutaminase-like putative cysteine protease